MKLMAKEAYKEWSAKIKDETLSWEIKAMQDDEKKIKESFGEELAFGTAGIRSIMGPGPNRMNHIVVRRVSKGIGQVILATPGGKDKGVAIAYDTRKNSRAFAREAARTFAELGIKVYLFEHVLPTPILSYAIRHLQAQAGVIITASHNTHQYNGYKAYWQDGGQLVPKGLKPIVAAIEETPYELEVLPATEKECELSENILPVGKAIEDAYFREFEKEEIFQADKSDKDLRIVYSPLHGTGGPFVERILKEHGFQNLHVVAEQFAADPMFSTVQKPNPEEVESFALALDLAKEKKAEIVIATDPDADRIGLMVKDPEGNYRSFSGNQLGALLLDFVIKTRKELGAFLQDGYLVTTVVTSGIGKAIASRHGLEVKETLTGFKYIAEKIEEAEQAQAGTFIFGYEESGGYMAAPFSRDKDGIMGALLIALMTEYYKKKQLNLWDALEDIYRQYGFYLDGLVSKNYPGLEGKEEMNKVMEKWRNQEENKLCGLKIKAVTDFLHDDTGMPPENVLKFYLAQDAWLALRPSGTEPKIKVYISVTGKERKEAEILLEDLKACVKENI